MHRFVIRAAFAATAALALGQAGVDAALAAGSPEKGKTAFIRKAIAESKQGKDIFGIISSHGGQAINLLLTAGAELRPIGGNGRVAWLGVKTRKPMPSPVPTLFFALWGKPRERRPGRPPISRDRAMTPAERQTRRRARLKSHET